MALRVKAFDPSSYERTFEVEYRAGAVREKLYGFGSGRIKLEKAGTDVSTETVQWHVFWIAASAEGVNIKSDVYVDGGAEPILIGCDPKRLP